MLLEMGESLSIRSFDSLISEHYLQRADAVNVGDARFDVVTGRCSLTARRFNPESTRCPRGTLAGESKQNAIS
jgi:hypothetical protein